MLGSVSTVFLYNTMHCHCALIMLKKLVIFNKVLVDHDPPERNAKDGALTGLRNDCPSHQCDWRSCIQRPVVLTGVLILISVYVKNHLGTLTFLFSAKE